MELSGKLTIGTVNSLHIRTDLRLCLILRVIFRRLPEESSLSAADEDAGNKTTQVGPLGMLAKTM